MTKNHNPAVPGQGKNCRKKGKKEEKDIFFLNKGCNLPAVCYIT